MLKIFITIFFCYSTYAYAYFDPGTGSYIIQLIIAFLASCYFFITNPIKFLKEYLRKFKRKKEIDQENKD